MHEQDESPKIILIVDDDKDIRDLVKAFLVQQGKVQLLEAANGLEAVDQLLKNKVDLMILDLHMPHMNGLEVTSFVNGNPEIKDLIIVMFTSVNDRQTRQKAMAQGVNYYINKPFNPIDFKDLIENLLV